LPLIASPRPEMHSILFSASSEGYLTIFIYNFLILFNMHINIKLRYKQDKLLGFSIFPHDSSAEYILKSLVDTNELF
jgi:hypothetical protein